MPCNARRFEVKQIIYKIDFEKVNLKVLHIGKMNMRCSR